MNVTTHMSSEQSEFVGQTTGVFVVHVTYALCHTQLDTDAVAVAFMTHLVCSVVTNLDLFNPGVEEMNLLTGAAELGFHVIHGYRNMFKVVHIGFKVTLKV